MVILRAKEDEITLVSMSGKEEGKIYGMKPHRVGKMRLCGKNL